MARLRFVEIVSVLAAEISGEEALRLRQGQVQVSLGVDLDGEVMGPHTQDVASHRTVF